LKYIFIHIGKTAGTSFRKFLESNVSKPYWGYGKLWNITDLKDIDKFIEKEPIGMRIFDYFDLFSEHFQYGLHHYLKTKEYQYITVLRDPIKRTISSYRYAKDREWISHDVSFIDWFKEQYDTLIHYQINHISGAPFDLDVETKKNIAFKNMKSEKFLFGFTEHYNEFIDLCCNINNWVPEYKKTNISKTRNDVTEKEKIEISKILEDEILFYNEALKIYNNKYKKFINND